MDPVQVNRLSVFEDTCQGLSAADVFAEAGPCVVSPCFITAPIVSSTAAAADASSAEQAIFREEGEGYGPRKEVFLLIGKALIGEWISSGPC